MNQERPRRATPIKNYAGLDSEDCGLGLGMRGSDADVDPSEILPAHGTEKNPILVDDDPAPLLPH